MCFVVKLLYCVLLFVYVLSLLHFSDSFARFVSLHFFPPPTVEVEPYWPKLFAGLLANRDIGELLSNVGGGAAPAAAAPAAAASAAAPAAAKKEEKKPEPEEEAEYVYTSLIQLFHRFVFSYFLSSLYTKLFILGVCTL